MWPVKCVSNLKQQLITLEKYVRFYFVAGTIITPLLILLPVL